MKFSLGLATDQSTGPGPQALLAPITIAFGWALALRLQSLATRQRRLSWRRLLLRSRGLGSKSCPV